MSNIFEIIDRVDPLSLRGMQRRNNPESRVYLDCFVAVLPTMTMRWEKTYHKDTAKSVTANTRFVPQLKRRDDACRKTGTKSVVQQVSRLSGSPKDFNVNNPEQTKCSSGTATVSTPKKLNCFAVLMMRRQYPELRLRLARGYSHLTPSALDAEPVNVLLAKSVTVRVQSEAIRSIGFSGLLPAPLLFCHDKIGKKGQKNEKKAQFIWNIVDKFTSWANGITLNNVNGIKNILINLERPAKQTAFHYRDITDCFRKEIQKKSGKDPVIISCIKDDCKIAGRHGPSLKQIRYRQKPAEIY